MVGFINSFIHLSLGMWDSNPPKYVDSLGSITLAYGMVRMAGRWDRVGIDQTGALGSRIEGMPDDILGCF